MNTPVGWEFLWKGRVANSTWDIYPYVIYAGEKEYDLDLHCNSMLPTLDRIGSESTTLALQALGR
jgi:hypothetical protein